MNDMSIGTVEQIADAYRRMVLRAGHRPMNAGKVIAEHQDLDADIVRYVPYWWEQENKQEYSIGCPDWSDRKALIWTVEAAGLICGGALRKAAKLLRMAADELESRAES